MTLGDSTTDELTTGELVLSFCPPESSASRTSVLTATEELRTATVLEPLFRDRPASGFVPLEVNVTGCSGASTQLHGPWILDHLPDRIALDAEGALVSFREGAGRSRPAPPGADRAWLREQLGQGGGLVEVLVDPDTPFGATWEACLEVRAAGRGLVRLALPIRRMRRPGVSAPPPPLRALPLRLLAALLEPFVFAACLLVWVPLVLLVVGVQVLLKSLKTGLWPRTLTLTPRSPLEAKLFGELERCPACEAVGLERPLLDWVCEACEAVIVVAPARPTLGRRSSEMIDLRGWIELAERRQLALDQLPTPTADGLRTPRPQLQRELVHCLTEALALHTADGELRDGAMLYADTADWVRTNPERCSRDRIVTWLFELPALAEIRQEA